MPRPRAKTPAKRGKVKSSNVFKHIVIAAGAFVLIAGIISLVIGILSPPGEKGHDAFLTGSIVIGAAVAIIVAAAGWLDAGSIVTVRPGLFYTVSIWVGVGIFCFIRIIGMHQIGGFDHSTLVEVGWRLAKGQVPYVDFPCPAPIAFMLGAKFAFQWFGVFWSSLIDMAALFAAGTFAWSLFLLTELFGRRWTTLLWATTLQAMSMMLVSFWWYNPITAVSSTVYIFAALLWLHRPSSWPALASYGGALLLISTMKPNVAGVLVLFVSIVLVSSPAHRWKTLLVSALAFGLFVLLLYCNHISLSGMVKSYLSVARRVGSIRDIYRFTSNLTIFLAIVALVMVLILPLIALWKGWRAAGTRGALIGFIALFGGLSGFITNGELKLVDLTAVLCASLALVAELRGSSGPVASPIFQLPSRWSRYFSLTCIVLATTGAAQGLIRDRIQSIGLSLFFEYDGAKHTIDKGFFKGLVCGDIFLEVNREIEEVLRQIGSASVWFGPRMQWGYAAFQKPSPAGEPAWWDPGVSFPMDDKEFYFNRFLMDRNSILILFKNDFSYFSNDMIARMTSQYDVSQAFPLLTVMVIKQNPPANPPPPKTAGHP